MNSDPTVEMMKAVSKGFWYGIAIVMFFTALVSGKEVFALLALVAAMMRKD